MEETSSSRKKRVSFSSEVDAVLALPVEEEEVRDMGEFVSHLQPSLYCNSTKAFSVVDCRPTQCKKKDVYLDLNCDYTNGIISTLIARRPHCRIVSKKEMLSIEKDEESLPDEKKGHIPAVTQISDFENIKWEMVMGNKEHSASSYLVRKGLSRKAQLALQVKRYSSKHPETLLKKAIPTTFIVETWNAFEEIRMDFGGGTFANFDANTLNTPLRTRLGWCLDDIRPTIDEKTEKEGWQWILKPSVTNKGADIAICVDYDEVLDALEASPDIREWVLQRYINKPLLVQAHKFHLRVYILCVGALQVYVYDNILLLMAAHKYDENDMEDIYKHLTNTARSAEDITFTEEKYVKLLDDLPYYLRKESPNTVPSNTSNKQFVDGIKSEIHAITKEVFSAFENEYTVFAPMANCFELYGLDFMVDEDLNVQLLEINPGPDFKQTGDRLRSLIVGLWEQTCSLVVDECDPTVHAKDFTLAYDKEASVSKLGGMKFTK